MANRLGWWTIVMVIQGANTVIMLTKMVADMNCRNSSPRKIWECHNRIIDLMNNDIEIIFHAQGLDLKLTSPDTIFGHFLKILFYCLIIFYEWNKIFSVLLHILNGFVSILSTQFLIAISLVSDSSKEAVSIPSYFLQS
jgi:hypothetical protein